VPGIDFGIDFFQHGCVLSARRKIALDFFIPGELVMAGDVAFREWTSTRAGR